LGARLCPKVKKLLSTFISVFSLANVFFIPEWVNFFGEHSSEAILVTPTPRINAYFAMGFTVAAVSVLVTIFILIVEKYNLSKLNILIHGILLLSLGVSLNFIREATGLFYLIPQLSYAVHFFDRLLFNSYLKIPLALIFLFLLTKLVYRFKDYILPGVKLTGLVLSPLLLICYGNLVNSFWVSVKLDPTPNFFSGTKPKSLSHQPKIVWIIFDEMDFRLVFEKRPSGIKLPELDRMKREAIFLTKAYPPSDYTLHSIPSLLVGKKVDVTAITPADLVFNTQKNSRNEKWTELGNVFKEAKEQGYSTSVVGWYHSYCRVLKSDLDFCRRLPGGRFGYGSNFWDSVEVILGRSFIFDRRMERAFIHNLEEMHKIALKVLKSQRYDFSFLHFSVPHKPYIFDTEKMKLSARVSRSPKNYFGNLVMVDAILGDIRKTMEDTGEWNSSVVVVTSDHSWRKSEEYDAKRDYRVPFIVKMPDSQSVTFNNAFPTLLTEDFIVDLIGKKIKTTPEAVEWLRKNSPVFPKGTVLSEPTPNKASPYGKINALEDVHS
jgi:hypothetical protein